MSGKKNAFLALTTVKIVVKDRDGKPRTYAGRGLQSVAEREAVARKATEIVQGTPNEQLASAAKLAGVVKRLDDGYSGMAASRILSYANGVVKRQASDAPAGQWLVLKNKKTGKPVEQAIEAILNA